MSAKDVTFMIVCEICHWVNNLTQHFFNFQDNFEIKIKDYYFFKDIIEFHCSLLNFKE